MGAVTHSFVARRQENHLHLQQAALAQPCAAMCGPVPEPCARTMCQDHVRAAVEQLFSYDCLNHSSGCAGAVRGRALAAQAPLPSWVPATAGGLASYGNSSLLL